MEPLATALNGSALRIAAYVVAAGVALVAARRSVGVERGRLVPAFWASVAVLLVLLAIGREFSVAGRLADAGRDIFDNAGWYAGRRPIQKLLILAILLGAAAAAITGGATLVARERRQLLAGFLAMLALATFLVVRAISWHSVDDVLYRHAIADVQISALAELTIVAVAACAAGAAAAGASRPLQRPPDAPAGPASPSS
ncbi:MAG: hypothetical protein IVW36_02430 [Dehalococcoidia bacterium]|nr:hypothetical protein [Dehalococcoidia bacterium]